MKNLIELIKGYISAYYDFHKSNLKHLFLFHSYGKGKLSLIKTTGKPDFTKYHVLSYKSLSLEGLPTEEELVDYRNGIKFYALVSTAEIEVDFSCEEENDIEFDALNDIYKMLQVIPNEHVEKNVCRFLEFIHNTCFKGSIKQHLGLGTELENNHEDEELIKTLRFLLNPKKGTVVHPMAGICNFITLMPEDITYSASYENEAYADYWEFFSKMAEREFNISGTPADISDAQNGYVLVDRVGISEQQLWGIIKMTIAYNATGVFLIEQKSLFKYKKSVAQIYGPDAPMDFLSNINYIIYLPKGLAILAIKNRKTEKDYIELFDATAENINCRGILEKLQKRQSHRLSFTDFIKESFKFDLNDIISKNREKNKTGFKNRVYLKDIFLTREQLSVDFRKYHIESLDDSNIDINDYSKYLPYYRYENNHLIPILEKTAKELKNRVLIVDLKNRRTFKPLILSFDTEEELKEFRLPNHCFLYRVNEDDIDFNYLVNEMNKPYFINQIFPTDNDNINLVWEYILECYIELPDIQGSSTPIKRQRLHYNREKWTYLKALLDSFDYNIDDFTSKKAHPLPNGSLIKNGRYRIEENLGAGGFGIVYKAFDIEAKRFVAIKEFFDKHKQLRAKKDNNVFTPISNDLEEIMEARKMFMAEAIKIMGFTSDKFVKIYDVFDDNDTCYYSMEYINGCDLGKFVEKHLKTHAQKALEETLAVKIIKEVCLALKEMHDHKMCHYDISPDNIMIDTENNRIVLVDFGSAKTSSDTSDKIYTKRLYSPAPFEKLNTNRKFYPQWDIYSLGVTLYYMSSGEIHEYECSQSNKNVHGTIDFQKPANVSDETWNCIIKAVNMNYKKRQQSVDEFLAMLPSE